MLAEPRFVDALDLLEFGQDEKQELIRLRALTKERGWWDDYADLMHGDVLRMLGFEYGAQRIRCYESTLITGLLQTTDYTREVIGLDMSSRPADIQRKLELRTLRRDHLFAPGGPDLTVVMGEASLRQTMGSRTTLHEQLQFLLDICESEKEAVEVRIHPFDAPPRGVAGSSTFYLFDFEKSDLPTVAWQEAIVPIGLTEEQRHVQFLSVCYEQVLSESLDRSDSLSLIQEYVEATSP
jgi:hypothetical protein